MANDIRAGAAFVELYMKGTFKKDLADAQRKLQAFGDSLTNIGKKMLGVGVAISAPLVLAVQQFTSLGDALYRASQRTGIAVEELSALKFAAEQSGTSFEDLETGIRKMAKAIFEAETGTKSAIDALKGLGLSVEDIKGLDPERQFTVIAERLSLVQDAGAKAAIAMELFGRGGTALLPLIEQGAAGINQLTKQAQELGLVMSTADAESAAKFKDTLKDLTEQIHKVLFVVGAAVSNALQPFAIAATKILKNIIDWVDANRSMVVGILLTGASLIAAGTALIAFGAAVKTIIFVGSAAVSTFQGIGAALTFLLNPIVLVGVGIAALAIYFAKASGQMAQVVDWLGAKFGELSETVKTALSGIADALSAGNILLAAQILWVGLQVVWAQGTQELHEAWIKFKYGFVAVAVAAFYGALDIYQEVKTSLIQAFEETVAFFGDILDGFVSYFGDAWDTITSNVAKGILYAQSLFDGSDYDSAAKAADDQLAANKAARDDAAQKSIEQRAAQLQADLTQVEKERDAALKENDNESIALVGGADAAAKSELDELNKKKSDLEKQLADLRAQASKEKQKTSQAPPTLVKPGFDLDDIVNNRALPVARSAGIFNAAAIQSLQSSPDTNYLQTTAKATQEIAKNTRKTAQFK